MPAYDEEDDAYLHYRDEDSRDLEETVESEETPRDAYQTMPCTSCHKLIFEDLEKCPYCGHWQMEREKLRNPLWFVTTVFICVAAVLVFWIVRRVL